MHRKTYRGLSLRSSDNHLHYGNVYGSWTEAGLDPKVLNNEFKKNALYEYSDYSLMQQNGNHPLFCGNEIKVLKPAAVALSCSMQFIHADEAPNAADRGANRK